MHLIILRKYSIKRTLAIATILILIGLNLRSPHFAQATEPNLYYLYPYPSSNPSRSVLFWSETDPNMGAYNLAMWSHLEPDRQIVIGLPEGYQVNSAMIANNTGKAIVARIKDRLKNGKNPAVTNKTNPKDILNYEREITPEGGIKEKVRVEIVEHFKDNDNFKKYMEIIKSNLISNELPSEKPASPKDGTAQAMMLFGNTITLAGLAMLVKVLALAL